MNFSPMRHRVTLETPAAAAPDGDGGAAYLWPPAGGVVVGQRVAASVDAIGPDRLLDRQVAKTTEGVGTYLVTVRYLPGVTLQSRVTFHDGDVDRVLWVVGLDDPERRHVSLVLTCTERVA